MKIFYLKKFIKQYKKLLPEVKNLAEEKESIFRENPFDSRLKTHKLHGELKDFLAFSVNNDIRIIFDFDENKDVRFYTIGNHIFIINNIKCLTLFISETNFQTCYSNVFLNI